MHFDQYIEDESNEKQLALLFVPDISGFTKFVHETEISHSTHIISELLELIIDNNELDLSVSEVEGDAILFYKFGNPPTFAQLVKQSKRMFTEFHKHLKYYERDRICQCGACATTTGLKLKFIVHLGNANIMRVKKHYKLLGTDVNIVHKLLKNNVQENEYVLITEKYISSVQNGTSTAGIDWVKLQKGSNDYEEVGVIEYKYFSLTSLLSQVSEPQKPEGIGKTKNPISISVMIKSPLRYVHSIVTDVRLKSEWSFGLRKVKVVKHKIVRVGTVHQCIMPFMVLEIEATRNMLEEGSIEYAERFNNMKMIPDMNTFSIIERKDDENTLLTFEIHYGKLPIIGWMINIFARPIIRIYFRNSIKGIKTYCEKNYKETKIAS